MDLEFLWHLMLGDDRYCRYGAAERLWKEQNRVGEGEWHYPRTHDRNATRVYPKINDPAGLLRSLHSTRGGPGMRNTYHGGANP